MSTAEDANHRETRARRARKLLGTWLQQDDGDEVQISIQRDDGETLIEVSRDALEAFRDVLAVLEEGRDVKVVERDRELTTGEAADLLNVSRPHLVELLESGEIPFHKVGSHRRVHLDDVLAYKRHRKQKSRERLEALAREDERLDIDY